MKKRKIAMTIFSIIYFAPLVLGGWYFVIAGLSDNFWGVSPTLLDKLILGGIVTLYGVVYSAILSLVIKLPLIRTVLYTAMLASGICLFISWSV